MANIQIQIKEVEVAIIHYKVIWRLGIFFCRKVKNTSMRKSPSLSATKTFKNLLKELDEKLNIVVCGSWSVLNKIPWSYFNLSSVSKLTSQSFTSRSFTFFRRLNVNGKKLLLFS